MPRIKFHNPPLKFRFLNAQKQARSRKKEPVSILSSKTAAVRKAIFHSPRKHGYQLDIAKQLGTTQATVSTIAKQMKRDGIIEKKEFEKKRHPRTILNSNEAQVRKALFHSPRERGFQARLARKSGLTRSFISLISKRMQSEGIIPASERKQKVGGKTMVFPHTKLYSNEARIRRALFNSKREWGHLKAIASETGTEPKEVSKIVSKMISEGIIQRRHALPAKIAVQKPAKANAGKSQEKSAISAKKAQRIVWKTGELDRKATEATKHITDRGERMKEYVRFIERESRPITGRLLEEAEHRIKVLERQGRESEKEELQTVVKRARSMIGEEAVELLSKALEETQ